MNNTFTNNRNQSALDAIEVELTHMLCLSNDYQTFEELNFAEWAKIDEEEWETVPTKGTRHPSTRAERRKKTAHAKERKNNTIRTREMRKYPYSLMLGKGKRHDHVWVGEKSIIESRQEAKRLSELRDWWTVECESLKDDVDDVDDYEYDYEDARFFVLYEVIDNLKRELEEKEAFIRFLQSQIQI